MTVVTLIVGGNQRQSKRSRSDHLTLCLNYNLLALSKDDIDECLQTMYEAYIFNISANTCAVLVSATGDEDLKQYELEVRDNYRCAIYDQLFREGLNYASRDFSSVEPLRYEHVWKKFDDVEPNIFVRQYLDQICDNFAKDFMVIHRTSRVLRKCGQYQDLMLLSDGDDEAYSYCDPEYYGKMARPYGQTLFHDSVDVERIYKRKLDYTLVLDGDTGVPKGGTFDLMEIAAAHPERGIIQPSIKLHCTSRDTMFMHLESMRQSLFEPLTNATMAYFSQSSFFGKGLIKNSVYIENVIGRRNNLIERVPIDVLSHDTFEASLLRPLYAGSVYLLEAPSYNYVTWNIRERRWNRGEVLLAFYFWENLVGVPMRWLQSKLQGDKFVKTTLRTKSKLDFVTSYVAHSALRQMFMKPILLLYILLHYQTSLRYRYASIIIVMFLVLIFPKFATTTRKNYKFVIIETVASILQFTPEAFVGCVRIVRAIQANVSTSVKWVPQRAVEEDFKKSNPFLSSLKHLWGYTLFSSFFTVLVILFMPDSVLILVMFGTCILLPFYTGFTSLTLDLKSSRSLENQRNNLEIGVSTIAQPDVKVGNIRPLTYTNIAVPTAPHPEHVYQPYDPFKLKQPQQLFERTPIAVY
ncbi:hypothetical protein LOTGIDRAFT_163607 [Lottia gigantea]|uniref:Uncharacterized protein n=1 Tax=Lottia gigantea TaxID=225164 RepID=V4BQC6_LOTGI|nr:hypothetical protein LOTGIDRAFT_163607 [Lottia gigantea]ESO91079.1 hypothetical protein LOTGIDRAFT_163607 [Lottia gigantea]